MLIECKCLVCRGVIFGCSMAMIAFGNLECKCVIKLSVATRHCSPTNTNHRNMIYHKILALVCVHAKSTQGNTMVEMKL